MNVAGRETGKGNKQVKKTPLKKPEMVDAALEKVVEIVFQAPSHQLDTLATAAEMSIPLNQPEK